MALALQLDLELALCCARFTLPGNWQPVGGTWEDFGIGRVPVVRTIRHRGKRLWVTASNETEDGFAAFVARGLAGGGPKRYRHFHLHRSDPRLAAPGKMAPGNLGGVGVITRIGTVIAEEGWNTRSVKY